MNRRGFTFVELLIALSVSSVIGLSVVTLMGAVTSGITSKEDGRQSSIRLSTLKTRLSAYVSPARCVLASTPTTFTLWMNDQRESNTVHASEVRWVAFNPDKELIEVSFVSFPSNWDEETTTRNDIECDDSTDFNQLRNTFDAMGFVTSITAADQIKECQLWFNKDNPIETTMISFEFKLSSTLGETKALVVDEVIRQHLQPIEGTE